MEFGTDGQARRAVLCILTAYHCMLPVEEGGEAGSRQMRRKSGAMGGQVSSPCINTLISSTFSKSGGVKRIGYSNTDPECGNLIQIFSESIWSLYWPRLGVLSPSVTVMSVMVLIMVGLAAQSLLAAEPISGDCEKGHRVVRQGIHADRIPSNLLGASSLGCHGE